MSAPSRASVSAVRFDAEGKAVVMGTSDDNWVMPGESGWEDTRDPLTKRAISWIFGCIAIPNMILVGGFSTMAKGDVLFNMVSSTTYSLRGDMALFGATVTGAALLVFDWYKFPVSVRWMTGWFPVFCFYVGSVMKGRKYPWAGMITTLFMMPASLGYLHFTWLRWIKRSKFYGAVAALSLFTALAIAFMYWYYMVVSPGRWWNQETKLKLAEDFSDVYKYMYKDRELIYEQDCGPNKNTTMLDLMEKKDKEKLTKACKGASTVWFLSYWCPFIAIGCNIFVAAFCHATGATALTNIHAQQRLLMRFAMLIGFMISGMYACATMSATSIRLGSTLFAFFVCAIGMLCIWVYLELDLDNLAMMARSNPLFKQLVDLSHNDWVKAMGLGAVGGPILMFFFLNWLTQQVRKARKISHETDPPFTPTGERLKDLLFSWNITSVLLKIIMLGEAFFTLQVGVAKVTYIFLSWLNGVLSGTNFVVLCGLVFLIGATMFLLPPVPGLPVYLFAGILLGEAGRQDERIGFLGAVIAASAVSLFTKMCACVGQYMIGYALGRSLKVQQLIGVDKVPTRAIEKILKKRGLNIGKIAILVGGPDWPTSVTCGIIHVNIPQMLLGTIPVLVLLVPCILAGACLGRVQPGEESEWNIMASMSTGLAALVNMISMAYAVFTISQTIQAHGDDLAKPRPEHEAVAALTRSEQEFVDIVNDTMNWDNLSCYWRFVLVVGTGMMYFSNSIFVVFAEMCFRPFAVSSKIGDSYDKNGLENNIFNIVIAPFGWGALGLFAVALGIHIYFSKTLTKKAKVRMKGERKATSEDVKAKTARQADVLNKLREQSGTKSGSTLNL